MNLTDILPLNGPNLHKLSMGEFDKVAADKRKERLKPFADYMKECILECGPMTDDPYKEFAIAMVTICMIDMMIERHHKEDVI